MAEYGETAAELCRRANRAFNKLELFRDLYQRAFVLGHPERDGWYRHTQGERRHRAMYDSTFADAWERLANAIYTGMCPPWAQWFHLQPGIAVPDEHEDEVTDLLQPHSKSLWQALANSNFYQALHPMIIDLIAGQGHMITDEHPTKGLVFRAVPIYEVALETNSFGISARFWRRRVIARNLKKEFPQATLPRDLEAMMTDSPESDVDILTASLEHDRPNYETRQWILHEKTKSVLDVRDFYEDPWASPRWSVLSGEDYGRGPALKAEPTAYSTNEAAKLMLLAANISLFGMWLVDSERISEGTIQLGTGVTIPVKPNSGGDVANAMRPLIPSTSFDVANFTMEELRSQIRRNLYRDNLAAVERPGMTATEVLERQSLVAQDMGAAYGRMTHELLQPILKRVSGIMKRRGGMPPDIRLDGQLVAIQYTSALARAQQYEEVVGMRAFIQDVVALSQIDPQSKYAIKSIQFARRIAALTGVDLDTLRNENETIKLAMQEAEGQAELMETEAAAAQELAAAKQGLPAAGPGFPIPGQE